MRNRAQCMKCKDSIESKSRHDFVMCSCGEIFVDGGQDYFRWGANDVANFRRIDDEDTNNNN